MAQKRATWPLRILVSTFEVRTDVSWCGSMMGSGMIAEPSVLAHGAEKVNLVKEGCQGEDAMASETLEP